MRRAVDGEAEARAQLARRLSVVPRVLQARNQRLGAPLDRDELLDLVQETQLLVWRKLGAYEGRAKLETWLYRFCQIGLMKSLEKQRLQRWRTKLLANEDLAQRDASQESAATSEGSGLAQLLRHVSEREAQVLRLRYLDGLELGEIGELLGISTSSVKTHCYRALAKLRGIVAAQGQLEARG